jgi:hypothetical protein
VLHDTLETHQLAPAHLLPICLLPICLLPTCCPSAAHLPAAHLLPICCPSAAHLLPICCPSAAHLLACQVDNTSKVDIKSVQLLLEQCASIKDQVQMTKAFTSHTFEGLASGTSRTGAAAFTAMLPLDQNLRATSLGQVRNCSWGGHLPACDRVY